MSLQMVRKYGNIEFKKYKSAYNDDWYDWLSHEMEIPFCNGKKIKVQLNFSEEELDKYNLEISQTIENILKFGSHHREQVKEHVFAYYQDLLLDIGEDCLDDMPPLENADDVLAYVHISGLGISISQRTKKFYAVYSGGCDWEIEHGIMISFRNGKELAMVSGYGHICNSDAYGDIKKDEFIYIGNNISTRKRIVH